MSLRVFFSFEPMRLAWRSAYGSGPVKRTLSRPMPAPVQNQRHRAGVAARASRSRRRESSSAARARAELREDRRVVLHGLLGRLGGHPAPADDAVAADDVALPDLKFEALALLVLQFSRLVEAGRERVALDLRLAPLLAVAEFHVAVGLALPPRLELQVRRVVVACVEIKILRLSDSTIIYSSSPPLSLIHI